MGLSAADLEDADVLIARLQVRCNSGHNGHVLRHHFASRGQRDSESVDSWFSDLRDSPRKCLKKIAVLPEHAAVGRGLGKTFLCVLTDDDPTMCVASYWSSALS